VDRQTFVSYFFYSQRSETEHILSSLLCNFALRYAITTDQANEETLELNTEASELRYWRCLWDENMHTTKKNTKASLLASKEAVLEADTTKTKHILKSPD
jgi:hypothetical protein